MKDDTTKVSITKYDLTSGKELPGATLQIIDKNGNIVGDPIVGAITSPEQQKTLSKLIDQAIANSEG